MYKRSLTTQEAEKIVSLVESILTKPKLRYGYKLSELDGYSRIDVGHAFNLMIAKIYKNLGTNARENNDLNVFINAMDTSLVSMAQLGIPDFEIDNLGGKEDLNNLIGLAGKWSLISLGDNSKTEIASLKSERIAFGEIEAPSSFAEFCYLLLKSDSQNYWEKVYNHIGLEYHGNSKNSKDHSDQVNNMITNNTLLNMKKVTGAIIFIAAIISFFALIFVLFKEELYEDEEIFPWFGALIISCAAIHYTISTKFWNTKLSILESLDRETEIIKKQIEKKELLAKLESLEKNE